MLFTAASCGFPEIDGFLVFPRVRVRVREALSYDGHESFSCSVLMVTEKFTNDRKT